MEVKEEGKDYEEGWGKAGWKNEMRKRGRRRASGHYLDKQTRGDPLLRDK